MYQNLKLDEDVYNPFKDFTQLKVNEMPFKKPPPTLKATLLPYQLLGLNWLLFRE